VARRGHAADREPAGEVVAVSDDRGRTRVLIADDQEAVRTAFRYFLETQPDIEVVAEAADGQSAVALARAHRPDVCLFDIRMPRLDGLEATRLLAGPTVADPLRVIVVTTFDLDDYVYTAIRNGACGFLLKGSAPTMVLDAVRAAMHGESLASPAITVRLFEHLRRTGHIQARRDAAPSGPPLSERELGVTRLVAHGRTNAEIGQELFMSLSTVKTHLASIQVKVGARNRVEIAAWAWRHDVVRE
jgi:DNA-binding NarL/FixJ family response regulator